MPSEKELKEANERQNECDRLVRQELKQFAADGTTYFKTRDLTSDDRTGHHRTRVALSLRRLEEKGIVSRWSKTGYRGSVWMLEADPDEIEGDADVDEDGRAEA